MNCYNYYLSSIGGGGIRVWEINSWGVCGGQWGVGDSSGNPIQY